MIFLIILLTFFWGLGSLYLVAIRTKSLKSVFLKKPSILIGDFFIVPTVAGIIGNYYLDKGIDNLYSDTLAWLILIISLILTLISVVRFKLLHPLWLPHIVFYWFMTFIILLFLSNLELNTLSWWLVLIGTITHQSLGILFPKKFPEVRK